MSISPTSKSIPTLEALEAEAGALVRTLTPKAEDATLITLSGELGAGKTTFVQGIARALGITEHITSPTFVLEKVYRIPDGAFSKLVHIDAYRLEGKSLAPLGLVELLTDSKNLILLEWPEMVSEGELPPAEVRISLTVLPDTSRTLAYS